LFFFFFFPQRKKKNGVVLNYKAIINQTEITLDIRKTKGKWRKTM